MATKLTKYSQTLNIAGSDTKTNDISTPYTFQDWIVRNTGVLPGKEQLQYENYVKQWYRTKEAEVPTSTTVKEDYISLLKQLTLAFKSEADALWASDINFDDPDEMEQIIPFYATKLKEIAIYLINKREAVRRAKLKYNMTGTYTSLERIFHEYLLKAFTKRQFPGNEYVTTITDVSVLNVIPELSAVRSGFQIFVEELYDDASYFDRDPSLPVSAYFTFNESATTYLDSLNISPSGYEWLYSTGVSNLCADNPLLWSVDSVLNQYKNGVPLSAVELYDSDVLNDYNKIKLSQKYIGEPQYMLSGGYWSTWTNEVDFNLATANNWFYWLTGENLFENDTSTIIDPIQLSATNLIESGATAGINITGSDIISVSRNDSLSGAWLRLMDTITFNATMSARLNKGKNVFAFPFPGYGLSGEDLDWTGRSMDNLNQTFYYLDKNEQQAVYTAYWASVVTSVSTFNPVYINDTTLIEAGAAAAEKFSDADYIISRVSFRDDTPDFIFTGTQEYAWLYKMSNTDLPVKVGNNNLYWPLERYDTSISMFASATQCDPVALSSISLDVFTGAVASNVPDTADKIFKRLSPNSATYTEAAWLSGKTLPQPVSVTDSAMATGCYQPNIAMRILGGAYGSFIWPDVDTSADFVFKNYQHQKDCWYLKDTQFSLFKERPTQDKILNYNQWEDCTCRAVLYSPLGHPGNTFDDYEGMADFMVAITSPISSFSFKDWRGVDGKSYQTSNEFGWFKLSGDYSIEPDIGWGSGKWITNTGDSFMLSAGVMYLYYRNDMHRDDPNSTVPYLVAKYKTNTYQNVWAKMYLDKVSNEWKDAGVTSDMIIKPSDMLYYSHQGTYSFILTASHYEFSTQDVPVIPDFNNYAVKAVIGEPDLPLLTSYTPIQYLDPSVTADTATWLSSSGVSGTYYGMPTGAFTVSAMIQNLCAVSLTTTVSTITSLIVDYYTYTNEAINFMLNVPLSNARPYWAVASDNDDDYTKRKSIDIWSGSPVLVDDYNFITQPSYSNMVFNGNTYLEYNKRNVTPALIWTQPVDITVAVEDKKWCKILVDTNGVSNLSAVLYNNTNELIVSATNIPSNIVLDVVQDTPLTINYYARNGFTWTQRISNSSLGLPPTGGVWTPIVSGNLVTPSAPYAHLSNRHYPTYASVPSIGDLYSVKDSGGYFVPRLLGVSTAVSKNVTNELNTTKINNDQSKRGATAIYRNIDLYYSDRGLSNADQTEPVKHIDTDSSWMKAAVSEGQKAGMITQSRDHQEFMPYQTKYENIKSNDNGVYVQGNDSYDPWFGVGDISWENPTDWPSNWRKQYDIKDWYKQLDKGDLQVYQWKTDIFGNQYALMKSASFQYASIYDKKHTMPGAIWTRSPRNIVQPAKESLVNVLLEDLRPPELSDISNVPLSGTYGVLDIDIWFDTMMLYTSSGLWFYHLNFDYDTNNIYCVSDEINYIVTTNSLFGGTWFFEADKSVTVCTLLSCGDQVRPILRSLDLENNTLKSIYNEESVFTNMSAVNFTTLEHPVFTYDYKTKTYNVSYVGYNASLSGMYLTTLNIEDQGDNHKIISAKTIVPEA